MTKTTNLRKYGLFSKLTFARTGKINVTRSFHTRQAARNSKSANYGIVNTLTGSVIR